MLKKLESCTNQIIIEKSVKKVCISMKRNSFRQTFLYNITNIFACHQPKRFFMRAHKKRYSEIKES